MVFALCRTCIEVETQFWSYTPEQRALLAIWTSKILVKEYQSIEEFQIWHWELWSSRVYEKYINKYHNMMQEDSEYTDWVKSDKGEVKLNKNFWEITIWENSLHNGFCQGLA